MPITGEGVMGVVIPLKSILHMNPQIPFWLGTGTESTVKLTAVIADGWLPLGLVPETYKIYEPWIDQGLKKSGKDRSEFEDQDGGAVVVSDDVQSALDRLKPSIALYVGGIGHKTKNFHKAMMDRRGFGDAAERILELYLAKNKREAIEAVPNEFVDQGALIVDRARIHKRFRDWEDSGITGLTISGNEEALRLMAEVARLDVDPRS